jgi:phage terminase small subunit
MDKKYISPNDLSRNSKKIFSKVVPSRAKSPERVEMVHQALLAKDRTEQCAEAIKKEGLQIVTERSGVSHAHPLLKTEKDNRQLFLKIWAKLGFDSDPWDPRLDLEPFFPIK